MFLSKGTTCYKATYTSGGVDTRTYEEINAGAPIKEGETPNSFVYQLEEFCTLTIKMAEINESVLWECNSDLNNDVQITRLMLYY